jgi:RNA polymerase sigma-70 factor (ECF subfamily)
MDDLEFIQRCVNGDKQAWDEFLKTYSRLIYSYIYSVIKLKGSILTPENINDLFQEIFLSLIKDNYKKLRSFKARNGCSLASWLRQVVVNHSIDYLRKFKPVASLDQEDEDGFSLKELLRDDSPSIREVFNSEENLAHLKDCIAGLSNDDKYFLELHINQGLRLEELKEHFRLSRSAIDMRKSRIIDKLRECFKGKGFALDL